jgi:hypothetical protein
MAILRKVEKREGSRDPDFTFFCPGCKCGHALWTTERNHGNGAIWAFNGDMEKPTFSPSLLIRSHQWTPPVTGENYEEFKRKPLTQTKVETVCHSFVRDGRIEFLSDCTHELRGQTVPMVDF